jgi:hypothetical protein
MKKTTLALLVLAIASTSACKKKDAKPEAFGEAAKAWAMAWGLN